MRFGVVKYEYIFTLAFSLAFLYLGALLLVGLVVVMQSVYVQRFH
jgi:uncharacterized membrane protein